MAKKRFFKDLQKRLKIVFGAIAMISMAMAALMVATAFKARNIIEDNFDINALRADISADSLRVLAILSKEPADTSARCHLPEMPSGGVRLKVDRNIRIGREFSDKNPEHLSSAIQLGIQPISSLEGTWQPSRDIVKVESCSDYYIDRLTHSLPYLVPEAEQLLQKIGSTFRDSLYARGGGAYRIKVTSLLRTESTVSRLRRRNRNATSNSAHLYGTTFDISYSNFICDSLTIPRTTEDLKLLLAEILRDLHDRGSCWVKHERKQSCFHITVRK